MRDLGDFQTPPDLVDAVLDALEPLSRFRRILEPTCGTGNFINGLLKRSIHAEIHGIEIQTCYVAQAHARFAADQQVAVREGNAFSMDYSAQIPWRDSGRLLVVGNLPWVTNAELGALASSNVPVKSNPKQLKGLEAITGAANFDVAEYIWIKILRDLGPIEPTVAFLCKTSVARKVLEHARNARIPIASSSIRRFDAKEWFGASVDACLFTVELATASAPRYDTTCYTSLCASEPDTVLGFVDGELVSDARTVLELLPLIGSAPREWRQGVKHDAASVMELNVEPDGRLCNKLGELVDVEPEWVYPLLKGSSVFHGRPVLQAVLVPQTHPSDDTSHLAERAPKLWAYLNAHARIFDNRRSSIYRRAPRFGLFGIGGYSFAKYKVCVSGLHKEVRFRAIGPVAGKPVMLDDTCYLLPCARAEDAALIAALLNGNACSRLLMALTFWDSKRPITKRLLKRVDYVKARSFCAPDQLRRDYTRWLAKLGADNADPEPDSVSLDEEQRVLTLT